MARWAMAVAMGLGLMLGNLGMADAANHQHTEAARAHHGHASKARRAHHKGRHKRRDAARKSSCGGHGGDSARPAPAPTKDKDDKGELFRRHGHRSL